MIDQVKNDRRIQWKCRRGLMELDILFENFFTKKFQDLSPDEKKQFDKLLSHDDTQLYGWVLGSQSVPDHFTDLIKKIKLR